MSLFVGRKAGLGAGSGYCSVKLWVAAFVSRSHDDDDDFIKTEFHYQKIHGLRGSLTVKFLKFLKPFRLF